MKPLILLLALCSFGFAQTKPAAAPRYITPQQMKIYWYNQFKLPSSTDQSYSRIYKARQQFVESVRAGSYDTLAERTAAAFNAETAINAGDTAKATYYQGEVTRLDAVIAEQERAAAAAQAQAAQAARDFQTQALLGDIQTQLKRINSNSQQMRQELMKLNYGN